MLQHRRHAHLSREPLGSQPGCEYGNQNLDDDRAIQRALAREKNTTHPATTQLALDGIDVTKLRVEIGPEVRVGTAYWVTQKTFPFSRRLAGEERRELGGEIGRSRA